MVTIFISCISNKNCRLFTFSSSGDDEEPSVVVVRMVKQDGKENNELREPKVVEGGAQESSGNGKTRNILQGNNNATRRSRTDSTVTNNLPAAGTVHRDRSSALIRSDIKGTIVERQVTRIKFGGFPERTNFHLPTNSIPISGYTIFQQIECHNVYFHFTQRIFKAIMVANQHEVQQTSVCEGSTSKGPFPVYGEVPMIKNLMASLPLKYFDAYIPTASTKTNLPLTVSP